MRVGLRFAFDVLLAIVLLVLVSPILVLIAGLVKLDSPGPIFFRQTRVGMHGKDFRIFKFRSMHHDERPSGDFGGGLSPKEARAVYKTTVKGDARITPLGKIIRSTHLDELPQLFNVVKGEMSIVGPRPYTPSEIVDYRLSHWVIRHSVRPGITGLSQILSASQGEKRYSRISMDVFYVRKRGVCLDTYILIKTAAKFFARSSY